MDAILGIPCADARITDFYAIAAIKQIFEVFRIFFHGLLLGKLCGNLFAVMVCIASKAQEMVDLILGKRKSEGRFCYALRLCDGLDLFRFRGEEG